jgi:arylsulfatase
LNLTIGKTIALVFAVILLSSFQSNFVTAQQSTDFAAKGKTAYSSHFPGIIIWTQIKGIDNTFVFHGLDDELVVLRTTLTPAGECDQGLLCYDGTVNNAKNSQAIRVGDTFKLTIDTATNTENVSFLSGFLENVDVKISLTKIKTKSSSGTTETESEEKRPNILFIILDDTGFSDLALTGSEIPTPAIDSLAHDGTVLTNYHVQPTCSPTRSELLTGVDHHLNGFGTMSEILVPNQVGKPGYETYLNDNVVTIADLLKDAGYHTILSGKWHLGHMHPYMPSDRGFQDSFSLLEGAANHFSERQFSYNENATYVLNGEKVHLPPNFYSSDNFADYMINEIDKNHGNGKPMFMYLSFTTTHDPLQAPQEYIKKWEGKYDIGYDKIRELRLQNQKSHGITSENTPLIPLELDTVPWDSLNETQKKIEAKKMVIFAAMLDNMDHNIGRVIDHLKEIGQYSNTLIYLASDNGPFDVKVEDLNSFKPGDDPAKFRAFMNQFNNTVENMGNENSFVSLGPGWAQVGATPLSGFKISTSEGGMRVPAIIKIPYQSQGSKTIAFATVQDIAPTVLEYANVTHPGTSYKGHSIYQMDGKSLKPLLEGKVQRVHQVDEPFATELFGGAAVYLGDWKISRVIPPYGDLKWRLYDLSQDPTESHDISKENPELFERMKGYYDDYAKRVGVVPPEGLEVPRESDTG